MDCLGLRRHSSMDGRAYARALQRSLPSNSFVYFLRVYMYGFTKLMLSNNCTQHTRERETKNF